MKNPGKTTGCRKILPIRGHLDQEEMKVRKTEYQILLASYMLGLDSCGGEMVTCMGLSESSDFSEITFLLLYFIIIDF